MSGFDATFLNNVTRTKFLPALKNQIYFKPTLMNRLSAKGRVKDMTGRGLEWAVVLKKHQSVGLFSGYDPLANQPINPTVVASLSPANYYATVAISGDEERRNSGNKEKLLDMLKIQMDNAYETMKEEMIADLYGSATSRGGKNTIVGLAAAIGTSRTYANIASTPTNANKGWEGNVDATAYTVANLKDPTSTSYLPTIMRTNYAAASNNTSPDLLVSAPSIWNLYQDIAGIQNLRFNNTKADLGFDAIAFQGMDFVFDKYSTVADTAATTRCLYMLSTETLTFYVYPSTNFTMKEPGWQIPVNQDAKLCHILWSGQLVCDSPRDNAVLTSVGLT
jgi:hypothetical protein